MTTNSRFTTYNSVRLEAGDLERLAQLEGLQQLHIGYTPTPDFKKAALEISKKGQQNYWRNAGYVHKFLGGPENTSLIHNFVTYLARILKAEAGSIEPEKLEVIPIKKRNRKNERLASAEMFSKRGLKLPNGTTIAEHVGGCGHTASHGFDVTIPGHKTKYVEYFKSTDAAS
jgi:hypothetical protein